MIPGMVSVIVPNFNYGHLIRDCIESALSQEYAHLEVIVVDNFSTDDSESTVVSIEDSRLRFVQFHNGGVIAKSRNFGASLARGEFLAFLDSDDFWSRGKLLHQMDAFDESIGLSYHNFRLIGATFGRKLRGRKIGGSLGKLVSGGNPIVTSGVVIRASLFKKLGGFPENQRFHSAEDFYLWCKAVSSGSKIKFLRRCLGFYRLHASVSRDLQSPKAHRAVISSFADDLSSAEFTRGMAIADYAEGVLLLRHGEVKEALSFFRKCLRARPVFRYWWRASLRILLGLVRLGMVRPR